MRIAMPDEINKFITHIYDGGRKIGGIEAELGGNASVTFDHSRMVPGFLKHMEKSGLEIVRKAKPDPWPRSPRGSVSACVRSSPRWPGATFWSRSARKAAARS